jgi:hypothetical protein
MANKKSADDGVEVVKGVRQEGLLQEKAEHEKIAAVRRENAKDRFEAGSNLEKKIADLAIITITSSPEDLVKYFQKHSHTLSKLATSAETHHVPHAQEFREAFRELTAQALAILKVTSKAENLINNLNEMNNHPEKLKQMSSNPGDLRLLVEKTKATVTECSKKGYKVGEELKQSLDNFTEKYKQAVRQDAVNAKRDSYSKSESTERISTDYVNKVRPGRG